MSIIIRDPTVIKNPPHLYPEHDILMVNNDRKILVNPMEDLDMEEKLAVLTDIINADPVQNLVDVGEQKWDPVKRLFGGINTEIVNGYFCERYKVSVNAKIKRQKKLKA